MKNIIDPAKKFVSRNRNTIIVGAAATAVIVLQHRGIASLNNFLKEKNLFDEYYFTNELDS